MDKDKNILLWGMDKCQTTLWLWAIKKVQRWGWQIHACGLCVR